MEVIFLSSSDYENNDSNLGDCIIINLDDVLFVYDCGCQQHAERVVDYMKKNNFEKIKVILSHNDSDHFEGLDYLIDEGYVEEAHTLLLLKYIDDLINEIDDGRRSREGLKKQIKELYSNIESLSKRVKLVGIYDDNKKMLELTSEIEFVGPTFNYMIQAAAKGLDNNQSDQIDGETIVNATSVQLCIHVNGSKVLLTGDSSFAAIEENLLEKDYVQLPHHGKNEIAEQVFDKLQGNNSVTYIVSDNTGDSNGGSDKLKTKGHRVKNTKVDKDLVIPEEKGSKVRKTGKTLGLF